MKKERNLCVNCDCHEYTYYTGATTCTNKNSPNYGNIIEPDDTCEHFHESFFNFNNTKER